MRSSKLVPILFLIVLLVVGAASARRFASRNVRVDEEGSAPTSVSPGPDLLHEPEHAYEPEKEHGPVSVPVSLPTTPKPPELKGRPPQFVVLAFDGSKSMQMWQDTRAFAKEMTAAGKPLKFTYFISGVYFLDPAHKSLYLPPKHPAEQSDIGFASSQKDILRRIDQINAASREGHEIASHANGHFDGTSWTEEDWRSEFSQFSRFVFFPDLNNGIPSSTYKGHELALLPNDIVGFRAPLLGRNGNMNDVLKEDGFLYDSSGVAKPEAWPRKDANGLWLMHLARIGFATSTSQILSMDYNFYFKNSNGKDVAKKGTPEWTLFHDQMLESYRRYFEGNYEGNRAPVFIGHHFSLWNDGVYWEVMKEFAQEVCGKPEVRCVTHKELAEYLEENASK